MRAQFIATETAQGLKRNKVVTASVVLVTLVSLMFVGTALLLQSQVNTLKEQWYGKIQVSVFLCAKDSTGATCTAGAATERQRGEVEEALTTGPLAKYVDKVSFESRSQAFANFQEMFQGMAIRETMQEDQMPESFRVKLKDPENFSVVSEYFAGKQGVESVEDQRELLSTLFSVLRVATLISLGLALVMVIAAALLVSVTIRMSAHNRRRETAIMRLVGASNSTIQLPFLLEGVLAACLGAGLATGVLWVLMKSGGQWFREHLTMFRYISDTEVLYVAPWLFAVGIGVAALSSTVTLWRYMKV